ncbi:hypothetical protein ACWEN6_13450 [Sphaerisporangium sp. NPDC004334]
MQLRQVADARTAARLATTTSIVRMIGGWERGEHEVTDPYRVLIARALGIKESDLFGRTKTELPPEPSPADDLQPYMLQSESLIHSAAAQMTDFGAWVESTNVGAGTMAHLEEQINRLARESLHSAPLVTLAQAADLARRTLHLLRSGHQHLPQAFDLHIMVGKLCALMSWVSSDIGHMAAADAHARTGRIIADQVSHPALTALLLSAQSKSAFWEGRWREAAALARHGYDLAGPDSARVLLACQEADAWQAQGDITAAKSALTRADEARDQIVQHNLLAGPYSCGPARQANYTMAVHLRDHQPQRALQAAADAERAWRNGDAQAYGTWAQVRIGAAIAHLHDGEIDGAQVMLRPVLELPMDRRLATLTTRLLQQVTPVLAGRARAGGRQAVALSAQIREYCSTSKPVAEITSG